MTTYAGRDAILATMKKRYRDVPTRIGTVCIESLSSAQRTDCESFVLDENGDVDKSKYPQAKARWVVESVVSSPDDPVKEYTVADVEAVSKTDAGVIDAIVDAIYELNGVTDADRDAMEKNSGQTEGGG